MTETLPSGSNVPALEKGMDIIEFLAVQENPVSLQEISAALHKSRGELYRMIKWLVERQYIVHLDANDTYLLGDRIGRLFQNQPTSTDIISAATPIMQRISDTVGAACYLTVRAQINGVVLATTQSTQLYDLTIKVGAQISLADCPSGACFAESLTETELNELLSKMTPDQRSGFDSERDGLKDCGVATRFGVAGPGFFELSFSGPQQSQLFSTITAAKVLPNEQDAKRLSESIQGSLAANPPDWWGR